MCDWNVLSSLMECWWRYINWVPITNHFQSELVDIFPIYIFFAHLIVWIGAWRFCSCFDFIFYLCLVREHKWLKRMPSIMMLWMCEWVFVMYILNWIDHWWQLIVGPNCWPWIFAGNRYIDRQLKFSSIEFMMIATPINWFGAFATHLRLRQPIVSLYIDNFCKVLVTFVHTHWLRIVATLHQKLVFVVCRCLIKSTWISIHHRLGIRSLLLQTHKTIGIACLCPWQTNHNHQLVR